MCYQCESISGHHTHKFTLPTGFPQYNGLGLLRVNVLRNMNYFCYLHENDL